LQLPTENDDELEDKDDAEEKDELEDTDETDELDDKDGFNEEVPSLVPPEPPPPPQALIKMLDNRIPITRFITTPFRFY
jgi:hypothetical protein